MIVAGYPQLLEFYAFPRVLLRDQPFAHICACIFQVKEPFPQLFLE